MRQRIIKEISRDRFLTPDECARFCSAPKKNSLLGVRDYAILKVFLNCGLRKKELIQLRVKDFCRQGENYWLVVHSKGGTIDEQDIMSGKTIDAIIKYLKMAGHINQPEAPLFQAVGKKGRRKDKTLHRRSIDDLVKKYAKEAQIGKKVTPHTLRHTFGTELQALTGDIKTTQKAMRHKSLQSTMVYLHTDRDRVKQGLSKMNL